MSTLSVVSEAPLGYKAERDFTTLEAWKKVRQLKLFFYAEVIPHLPPEEKYNLNTQIRKASVSGTANIAQGYGRYYFKEGIQFLPNIKGVIYELKDHLISCFDLGFISSDVYEKGMELIEDAKITFNGYIRFVRTQKDNQSD